MKKQKKSDGKPALDLIEEAVHLLRSAPFGVHLSYYTGSIPFVLGLLYFWSDMSRGAFAYDRIVGSSLQLAFLFLWMKCWQAVSAAKLRAFLAASEEPRWTARRIWRLVVMQAALQPSALFLRLLALLITLPYGWVRAFYENALILGDGGDATVRELGRKAGRLAKLWPRQNVFMLLWLLLFGFVIWLNIRLLLEYAPDIVRTLTGIDTRFSQISTEQWVLNSTFLAINFGCAYLCVNPVTKAVYILRCFYGESIYSGDDLKLGMRRAVAAAVTAATALLLLMCVPNARGDAPAASPAPEQVKPQALDDSITRVLKRDEFSWRLPRQKAPEASGNFFSRFLDGVTQKMQDWMSSFSKWFRGVLDRWFNHKERIDDESSHGSSVGLSTILNFLLWVIAAVVILLLGWLIWSSRAGFKAGRSLKSQAVTVVPDLNSEDVVASQLPEDEWLKMAREMMERGEVRLAIRALYLATLAHLGLRELISIARYKSNRDYQRELRRRAGGRGELLHAFGDSVSIFEGVWYGEHATSEEVFREFSANIERIKIA